MVAEESDLEQPERPPQDYDSDLSVDPAAYDENKVMRQILTRKVEVFTQ